MKLNLEFNHFYGKNCFEGKLLGKNGWNESGLTCLVLKILTTNTLRLGCYLWMIMSVMQPWRTMEAPLRHINCRNLTLESAEKLTNVSSRIQDTTYFAVFLQTIHQLCMELCHGFMKFELNFHQSQILAKLYVSVSYFLLYNCHFLSKLDTSECPLDFSMVSRLLDH